MVSEELEKIKKLPKEERIKKLKEYHEKKRDELLESEKLLEDEEKEGEQEEESEERIPEEASSQLEEALEGVTASQEESVGQYRQFSDFQQRYISQLALEPTTQIYQRVQQIQEHPEEMNYEAVQNLEELQSALYEKQKAIETGEYPTTNEEVMKQLDSTRRILEQLITNYRKVIE